MIVLKTYDIIERAVEEGLEFSWNRADSSCKEVIMEHLFKNIMRSLDEIIDFSKIDNK